MANPEHLAKLKEGVRAWNDWRRLEPRTRPDLGMAYLDSVNLDRADLKAADLSRAVLSGGSLCKTRLSGADLSLADLRNADFQGANLREANLASAKLKGANFSFAAVGWTAFTNCDLSGVRGLDTVTHDGPSVIGIDAIYLSRGTIPHTIPARLRRPRDLH
jgi:uncharacterized protein YjbI with pentapeptide repeats